MIFPRSIRVLFLCLAIAAGSVLPAFAQQTGIIVGTVTSSDGAGLPGVTVEAKSAVLPAPRTTVTGDNGELPAAGAAAGRLHGDVHAVGHADGDAQGAGAARRRRPARRRARRRRASPRRRRDGHGRRSSTRPRAPIKSGISNEQISSVPVGQEYRDLVKLIPGVQYTQDTIRGPSAGGSGQDNVYQFDGVNVTLPLFGTLSAEPASHDIAQVTVIKGGARAVDFDRSGGFSIDSVSKSGTNRSPAWSASSSSRTEAWPRRLTTAARHATEQTRSWTDLNVGGPVDARERLFFYGSYYRPTITRATTAPTSTASCRSTRAPATRASAS